MLIKIEEILHPGQKLGPIRLAHDQKHTFFTIRTGRLNNNCPIEAEILDLVAGGDRRSRLGGGVPYSAIEQTPGSWPPRVLVDGQRMRGRLLRRNVEE